MVRCQKHKQEIRLLKRAIKREHSLPLTNAILNVGLALWWTNDKNIGKTMAWLTRRYSELRAVKEPAPRNPKKTTERSRRADRVRPVPETWMHKVLTAVAKWSDEDEAAISAQHNCWRFHLKKARALNLDVDIVAFVSRQNEKGKTVSSRAVIDYKQMNVQSAVADLRGLCAPLREQDRSWVRRVAHRASLTKGRFAQGECLTTSSKIRKVSDSVNTVSCTLCVKCHK